jgi:hypothetical protein
MLDLPGFRTRFPEFLNVDSTLLQGKLDDAALRLSPAVFGTRLNEAHGWLAAHLAASAPWGYQARLKGEENGKTVYESAYDKLAKEVGFGFGVT